jgi:hypothetical protein
VFQEQAGAEYADLLPADFDSLMAGDMYPADGKRQRLINGKKRDVGQFAIKLNFPFSHKVDALALQRNDGHSSEEWKSGGIKWIRSGNQSGN